MTRGAPHSILVVGQTFPESRTVQRTAAMRSLGCAVTTIPTTPPHRNYETPPTLAERVRYRLRIPADPAGANQSVRAAPLDSIDILWIEAAPMIHRETLLKVRHTNPRVTIVWYGEDDMMNPRHRSRWLEAAMPEFDLWLTTKSFNAHPNELPAFGVRNVLFVNNTCDPAIHRPVSLNDDDRQLFGSSISFIGSFESPRAASLLRLAAAGLRVRIWGNGWNDWKNRHPNLHVEGRPAYNDEFAKVVAASAINLCFLRKANRDLQTCRSIEIPACGGFMVHESSAEIQGLFRRDIDAVYWENDEELVKLCIKWLCNDKNRSAIAKSARDRVLELDLTHTALVKNVLRLFPRVDKGTDPSCA